MRREALTNRIWPGAALPRRIAAGPMPLLHLAFPARGACQVIRQYGVLAYDMDGAEPRFLLITSRRTRRWIIPRGNPIRGLSASETAAQEAHEEAGLIGVIGKQEIGSYRYVKWRRDGSNVMAKVHVFPFRATLQSGRWRERDQRDWRWFTRAEAAAAVEEPELKQLILAFTPPPESAGAFHGTPPPRVRLSLLRLLRKLVPGKGG